MNVVSPYESRERILNFGGPGAGKTWNWFDILKHTGEDVKFHVIDTDQTALPFLESEEFAPYRERVTVYEPFEWPEYVDNIKEIREKADRDDWVVVDMMNKPWDEVQNHYAEKVFGKDLGSFWTAYLEKLHEVDGKGSKSPFDGGTDWQAIKKMYATFTGNLVRVKGHLYLAAPEKKTNPQFDGSGVLEVGGMKPDCEKNTPHMVRTVIRMARRRATTGKDRQREALDGQTVNSFALDYLVSKAGWRIAK